MNLDGKIILAAVAFSGAILGVIFFVAIPLISEIESVRAEISAQQDAALKLDSRILKVRQYREFAKKEESNLGKLDDLLTDRQMPDFINYMEKSATSSGVEVVFSPSISQGDSEEGWSWMNYQADITGNIDNILKFVKKIEIGPYLVGIDGFSIQAGITEDPAAKDKIPVAVGENPGMAHISLKAYVKK